MTRMIVLVALVTGLVAGCAQSGRDVSPALRIELPKRHVDADPDILPTSLRPIQRQSTPIVAKPVKDPDLTLRLRSEYARLQLRWPLMPRQMSTQLTAIARSYVDPDAVGEPRGKFLLRLSFPLPFSPNSGPAYAMSAASVASDIDANLPLLWSSQVMTGSTGVVDVETVSEIDHIDDLLAEIFLPIPTGDRS